MPRMLSVCVFLAALALCNRLYNSVPQTLVRGPDLVRDRLMHAGLRDPCLERLLLKKTSPHIQSLQSTGLMNISFLRETHSPTRMRRSWTDVRSWVEALVQLHARWKGLELEFGGEGLVVVVVVA